MQIKGLTRLKTLCDKIGLKTLGDLKDFYKRESKQGEAVLTTLERYAKTIGKNFKIKN